jgi:hypothetical protein
LRPTVRQLSTEHLRLEKLIYKNLVNISDENKSFLAGQISHLLPLLRHSFHFNPRPGIPTNSFFTVY